MKSTQKYVPCLSFTYILLNRLPKPHVLVRCPGKSGGDWDGDVRRLSFITCVNIWRSDMCVRRRFQVYVLQTFFTKTGRRYKV